MKYGLSVLVCVGLASSIGCGAEDNSENVGPDPVETREGAASTAIFNSGKIRTNNVNTNCQVISGDVLKVGGWTATTPYAYISCPMPEVYPGQPWDTTRLREITYSQGPEVSEVIACAIDWYRRSNGVFVTRSPWMYSYRNSETHHVSFAEYYTRGDGWVSAPDPLNYKFALTCRIGRGTYLYSYTYSYEDTL